MDLSTNMSFDNYLTEMLNVVKKLNVDLKEYESDEFDNLIEIALYKLSKNQTNWEEISRNRLNLNYDGTNESFVNSVISLSRVILSVVHDQIPEIDGDLDLHILRMLLIHFVIRLLYKLRGKYNSSLGELQVENLIATIRQKPVKLYNVLKKSYLSFIEVNYPDIIVVNETIDDV